MAESKVKLTKHMEDMLEREGMIFVGTCSKDGVPNVSVRTAYAVLGDDAIVMLDYFRHKTYWNWQENDKVAVSVVDRKNIDGYQFKGKCEIITETAEIKELLKKIYKNPHSLATLFDRQITGLPPIVIKFTIEEVYSLRPVERSKERIR